MIYVDILNEMESIGNDALNVVQAGNHVAKLSFIQIQRKSKDGRSPKKVNPAKKKGFQPKRP